MPLNSIPRHIGLAAHDIEMLAGLEEGYLQGKPKIVQFARLRPVTGNTNEHEIKKATPFCYSGPHLSSKFVVPI